MELNWSTFLLEILNFLVLVWILKHFFYKPLQAVIARRQAAIAQQVDEARQIREDAQQLQQRYEAELTDLHRGRQQARENLQREINDERVKLERELADSLQQQRHKSEVIEQRQLKELQRQQELRALEQGSRFAARLLKEGAGPELESGLLELLLDALRKLPGEQLPSLRQQLVDSGGPIEVVSAFPLSQEARERIEETFEEILQGDIRCHFLEDTDLIAGLRIGVGPWVLGVNVRDELEGFARLERETANE